MRYDVAIVGLGAMGSACAYALARRGASVIGFDKFAPPHGMGSTHGHTRIIREAYYEHPLYVPLVRRAYELWAELEQESGESLLVTTGGLTVGSADCQLVQGARESAVTHGIEHEMLDAAEISKRFPAYRPKRDWVGVFERRAGMLFPERCVSAHLGLASKHGAALRVNEPVAALATNAGGVRLTSAAGVFEADRMIIAAGSWLPDLAAELGASIPVDIERQISTWFEPVSDRQRYRAPHCPVALWEAPDGEVFATLPDEGHGVKCGMHHSGAPTSPDTVNRAVSDAENGAVREMLDAVMPGAGGRILDSKVCLYTNTPDRHFVLGWLADERTLVVSPCSGHGFKFASAVGEIAAQLAAGDESWIDLTPFSPSRFH